MAFVNRYMPTSELEISRKIYYLIKCLHIVEKIDVLILRVCQL